MSSGRSDGKPKFIAGKGPLCDLCWTPIGGTPMRSHRISDRGGYVRQVDVHESCEHAWRDRRAALISAEDAAFGGPE